MTPAAVPPRPSTSPRIIAWLAAVAVGVFALDQATKQLVLASMTEGERIPVVPGVLEWFFVRNAGAAFSIASGMTWIFSLVALGVIVAIAVVARRLRSGAWATVFGAVLGGTLGNLLDRLFREPGFGEGHVIDFISTPWLIPAIYNVADIGIVLGMCGFVLVTILDIGFDGVRGRNRRRDPGGPDAGDDAATGHALAEDGAEA